jgi:short-subunit dehydrogenase
VSASQRRWYGDSVLVTGASSGIGAAVARLFADAGYRVYAASRSGPLKMDVTSDESVATAVAELPADLGIVVHCAGMGIAGAAEDTPLADARDQMEINYFGVLRVNQAVLPRMRERGNGLVVIVGSVAGVVPIPFQSHYSSSKFALEAYAECLAMESRPFGIRVALVAPGDTKTGFTAARRMAVPEGSPYGGAAARAVAVMAKDEQDGAAPEDVAKAILRLTRRADPPARVTVGASYKAVTALRRALPTRLFDQLVARAYS